VAIALYIIGALAACYVAYVFGYGVMIAIGAEYEWVRGRRIRGGRAVLLGGAMMLSVPLFATVGWGMGRLGWIANSWERWSVAALITAAIYWPSLRAITQKFDAEEE
jgi:hypothetical protein